jgi:hypothetical protein
MKGVAVRNKRLQDFKHTGARPDNDEPAMIASPER